MITDIIAITTALGAIAGLLTVIYKTYWSPAAKRKRQALSEGKEAARKLNVSGITRAFNKIRRRVLPLLFVLFCLVGCRSPAVILHVIDKEDIVAIPQGTNIVLPDDPNYVTKKDGLFLSSDYVADVMEAKVR